MGEQLALEGLGIGEAPQPGGAKVHRQRAQTQHVGSEQTFAVELIEAGERSGRLARGLLADLLQETIEGRGQDHAPQGTSAPRTYSVLRRSG